MSIHPTPGICPFCKQSNACQAYSERACWCNTVPIAEELIALVPEPARDTCCICRNCIELFNRDPAQFKKQMNLSA